MAYALRRFFLSSLSLWTIAAVFGLYFVTHLQKYVSFGIDLVGGMYITLDVHMEKVLEMELSDRVIALLRSLPSKSSSGTHDAESFVPREQATVKHQYRVVLASDDIARAIANSPDVREYRLDVARDGATLLFSLPATEITRLTRDAVASNMQVLRSRIDQFGVGEVTIAAHGDHQIIVELPHVHDVQRAKNIIGTAALLEIKPVLADGTARESIVGRFKEGLPDGLEIVPVRDGGRFLLVPKRADLTGKLLKTARANPRGGEFQSEPVVELIFTSAGGDKLYNMTSQGPRPRLAIIIDGVAVTDASVNKPPLQGTMIYLTGGFTIEKAQELSQMLRSGAFAAPVTFAEDRAIGPTLGAESIHRGLMACLIGLALLFVFSIFFYRLAGLLAFIVLLFNLLCILYVLWLLGATLTLPGIAGMVLTLGMAIDSSVLIYERIREELRRGIPLSAAVEAGFSGALTVILDANITTFLAAVVLYYIGVGPIQGFAVTMMVGILSTLLTGCLLLKSLFTYAIEGLGLRRLNI
jgi:preprotein translocase subunit SecD